MVRREISRNFRARRHAWRASFAAYAARSRAAEPRPSRRGAFDAIMARFHQAIGARLSGAAGAVTLACHAREDPAPDHRRAASASLTPSGETNHGCHRHRRRDWRHRHRLSIACGRSPAYASSSATPRSRRARPTVTAAPCCPRRSTCGSARPSCSTRRRQKTGDRVQDRASTPRPASSSKKLALLQRSRRVRRPVRAPAAARSNLSRDAIADIEATLRSRLRTAHAACCICCAASTNWNRPQPAIELLRALRSAASRADAGGMRRRRAFGARRSAVRRRRAARRRTHGELPAVHEADQADRSKKAACSSSSAAKSRRFASTASARPSNWRRSPVR